jgi:hypothetical protein
VRKNSCWDENSVSVFENSWAWRWSHLRQSFIMRWVYYSR